MLTDVSTWLWSLLISMMLMWSTMLAVVSMFLTSNNRTAFKQRILSFVIMFAAIMLLVVMARGG